MDTVVHIEDSQDLRVLLDLADNKRDVRTTTEYSGLAVVVPDELYQRFLIYQSLDSSSPVEPKKSRSKS